MKMLQMGLVPVRNSHLNYPDTNKSTTSLCAPFSLPRLPPKVVISQNMKIHDQIITRKAPISMERRNSLPARPSERGAIGRTVSESAVTLHALDFVDSSSSDSSSSDEEDELEESPRISQNFSQSTPNFVLSRETPEYIAYNNSANSGQRMSRDRGQRPIPGRLSIPQNDLRGMGSLGTPRPSTDRPPMGLSNLTSNELAKYIEDYVEMRKERESDKRGLALRRVSGIGVVVGQNIKGNWQTASQV
jgi:hypothetical protein